MIIIILLLGIFIFIPFISTFVLGSIILYNDLFHNIPYKELYKINKAFKTSYIFFLSSLIVFIIIILFLNKIKL